MEKKPQRLRVSSGEMDILAMLWSEGPLTLAQAHLRFGGYGRPVEYPTMQTRLNRLVDKGLVQKSDGRPAAYQAAVTADQVSSGHVQQLLDKLGRRHLLPLVAHLLAGQKLSPDELAALKGLVAEAERSSPKRRRTGETP
jgi:BlaI family transcriptional regulator, penicillinase repressor